MKVQWSSWSRRAFVFLTRYLLALELKILSRMMGLVTDARVLDGSCIPSLWQRQKVLHINPKEIFHLKFSILMQMTQQRSETKRTSTSETNCEWKWILFSSRNRVRTERGSNWIKMAQKIAKTFPLEASDRSPPRFFLIKQGLCGIFFFNSLTFFPDSIHRSSLNLWCLWSRARKRTGI